MKNYNAEMSQDIIEIIVIFMFIEYIMAKIINIHTLFQTTKGDIQTNILEKNLHWIVIYILSHFKCYFVSLKVLMDH